MRAGSVEASESVRRIAHRLRGTGGTFGFPEITTAAAEVEEAATDLGSLTAELVAVVRAAVERTEAPALHVLIVEDDPEMATLLKETLSGTHRTAKVVRTAEAALLAVDSEDVDLIVLDLRLPDRSGQDLLIDLRSRSRTAETPILVLSAVTSEGVRAECFALGADAYLVKPLQASVINAAVSHMLKVSGVHQRASRVDSLTGLPNRVALENEFRRMMATAQRTGQPVSLGVIDLDHFKRINDQHGHDAGDEVLRTFARRVAQRLRRSDLLARWGGEEFVVLLGGATATTAARTLQSLQDHLRAEPVLLPTGSSLHIGFSGGVCEVVDGQELQTAFQAADEAMYAAKSAGRGRVLVAGEQMDRRPRVLVLEDEPAMAELLRAQLGRDGYRVQMASTLEEAREGLARHVPAMALLDIDVPDGCGLHFLDELRRDGHTIPVMMLTARRTGDQVAQAIELGADDYVRKPFEAIELTARVRRLLKRR